MTALRCDQCRNPVRSNGYVCDGEALCGKCLTTPYEIRQRQIYGCLSARLIPTAAQLRAEGIKRDLARMGRNTFRRQNMRLA